MKFNINNYPGKYVMHCKTEEEARDFCNYLHSIGESWCTGKSYAECTYYENHKEKTTYNFNENAYSKVDYYIDANYTILEWEDFMNNKFTKADLNTGDIIQQRDGTIGVVNRILEMVTCKNGGWIDLDKFRNDLTHSYGKDFDIIIVRRPKSKPDCNFDAINREWGTLVYERKEVEEMTLAEVCRLLGKEIKIVK